MVQVTVDYGYDVHSIRIGGSTFARIQVGQPLVVEGQGFPVEGVMEDDQWAFNFGAMGAVHVSTVGGREVFEGNLGDDEVDVRDEQQVGAAQKGFNCE